MIVSKTVGIDLGTTNSVVAVMDEENKHIITHTDRMGRHIIPSVVGVHPKKGDLMVGFLAYSYRGTRNAPVVSIKRRMGSGEKVTLGGTEHSAEEISSLIVEECIRCMQVQLDALDDGNTYRIDKALVTVPAYFDINATDATRRAGEMAGVQVEVLQEPTAAAMYYIWKHDLPDGSYMVFDLGGGTFDVSIVNMSMGVPSVLGLSGNNYLGGDDFDRRLARDLLSMLQDSGEYTLDLDDKDPEDRLRMAKLVLKAEELKKELSRTGEVYFESANIFEDQDGRSVRIDAQYTREQFEDLISDLVDSAVSECEKAVAEAVASRRIKGLGDIQRVLLVGGSTKVPLVQERVRARFCDPAAPEHVRDTDILCDEPDFAVGYGAALCAAVGGDVVRGEEISLAVAQDIFEGERALAGKLEGLKSADGYRLQVFDEAGTALGGGRVASDGSFMVDVDTPESGALVTRVVDGTGRTVMEHALTVKEDTGMGAGSALVLPMDVNLDVWNAEQERVVKQTLIAKMTPLPTSATYTLYANESTRRTFDLNLYQGYDLLKVVTVEMTQRELEPGEPIALEVTCDKTFVITVEGQAAGVPIRVDVQVAPRELDSGELRAQHEELRAQFEKYIHLFSGGSRAAYMAEESKYTGAIEDGFDDAELPKVSETLALYQGLIERMRADDPSTIKPPKEEFDRLAGQGRMLLQAVTQMPGDKVPPDFSRSEVAEAMERIAEAGAEAYSRRDRKQVSEIFDKLQELCGYLYRIIQPMIDDGGSNPAEQLKRQIAGTAAEIESFVAENNPAADVRERLMDGVARMRAIGGGLSDLMDDMAVNEERRRVAGIYQQLRPLMEIRRDGPTILSGGGGR